MTIARTKPVRFALQLLPLFILFAWAYPKVLPYYQPLVLGAANAITTELSPSTRIETGRAGGWSSYVSDSAGREQRVSSWEGFVPHLIYLGLAFLPALLLATPAPIPERLRLLGVGLLLLYGVHVVAIAVLVRADYCLSAAPGTFSCLWLLRLVYASGQLSGAVIWAALTWRHWIPENWIRPRRQSRSQPLE